MENALLRQIKSLQAKNRKGEWDDNPCHREDEVVYLPNRIDEEQKSASMEAVEPSTLPIFLLSSPMPSTEFWVRTGL